MLLAVEGGGFFSSSASGYSKGLTLLLLGQKNEEKPMRVTPWNQYQLVDQENNNPDLQLAPGKNWFVRRCASFVCFGHSASGTRPDGPSPPKVGPTQIQEVLPPGPIDFDESKDRAHSVGPIDGDGDFSNRNTDSLKSSLKKSGNIAPVAGAVVDGDNGVNSNKHDSLCEEDSDVSCQMERRKVQWPDATGGELFEIREFEMSEDGSDNEFDRANGKTCACTIM